MKITQMYCKCLLAFLCLQTVYSLDNGLALTPPMGWLTWERFGCNRNCADDPDNCIGEKLVMAMADRMADDGYRDAGYKYVIIDDCWLAPERDKDGRLKPEPSNFPSGMKALADYVHSRGLLFGIYEDFGTETCAGYPGSEFYMELDANTFAEWGVDYVKFDGCHSNPKDMPAGYAAMAKYLNQTGRPMVYLCEWPVNWIMRGMKVDYAAVRKACNLWRNYGDISDTWDSVKTIANYFALNSETLAQYAGPGGWNDPDQLIIGDFSLSKDEQRFQFGMWCMLASPLIMSNDLRDIDPYSKSLLLNKRLIAINQDPLGKQGTFVKKIGPLEAWKKEILPTGSYAIALNNKNDFGGPVRTWFRLQDLGLKGGYNVTEVFDGNYIGVFKYQDVLKTTVNPHGVIIYTAVAIIPRKMDVYSRN